VSEKVIGAIWESDGVNYTLGDTVAIEGGTAFGSNTRQSADDAVRQLGVSQHPCMLKDKLARRKRTFVPLL